jgi:hypothetical protein
VFHLGGGGKNGRGRGGGLVILVEDPSPEFSFFSKAGYIENDPSIMNENLP